MSHDLRIALRDGDLRCVVTCSAEAGEWCRLRCPKGCDEWHPGHEHGLVDCECLALEWFEAVDGDVIPAPDTDDLRPGPVRVFYQDGWEWERVGADAATKQTEGDLAVAINEATKARSIIHRISRVVADLQRGINEHPLGWKAGALQEAVNLIRAEIPEVGKQ